MTKKQNRSRGFGKRSLSVVLTVLIVLSTFVVMMSATSLSAGAAISYWNVAGDFNDWANSLNNTSYRINSSAGDVTIPISSAEHSTITFKMVAYEDGWKWCGNSSGNMTVGSEGELSWNSGNDIKVNLPSNTVSVNFKIEVKNSKNYLTVTANTSGGGEGGDTSGMFYEAGVNKQNPANTADNLFWATATYYDYMSDTELSDTQWLKPLQAGTHNYNGANDEWYPFYRFNREVVKAQADAQSNWAEPLYFGNFCDTNNAYDSSHHQNGYDSYGYREATNDYNVTRFVHIANNSDYNQAGSAHLANMNCSYQGLMSDHLSSSGDLLLPNGQTAPYFNASSLEGRAKVVTSSFPFKVQEVSGKKYKKYTFNSKNATDNVYFTWATNGNQTYPTGVNYGAGTTYGVLDGVSRFMNGGTSGYGIFPFNNASNNYKGTKTNANENLNYGFGIKTQVKFRVPAPDNANGVNTSSDPIYFRFSGDDDLWMYITDEDGNSQLVLDMGGDHKESTGYVNFNTLKATVDKVGTSGTSKTKSFTFDYNKTYTMTVFYMERGLIESNCEMEFTLTPMGNSFVVTEEIDTVGVNAGLEDAVRQLSTFGFNTLDNGSQISDAEYGDFELGDGGRADIGDNALPINSNVKINQYAPQNSYLTYDTVWDYYNNVNLDEYGNRKHLGHGTGVTSNGVTTVTSEQTLINDSGNEYDYAELQVDYRNTPQIGSFTVTKQMEGGNAGFEDQEFPATIYLQFKEPVAGTNPDQYEQMSTYNLVDDAGVTHRGGRVNLKPGQPITFSGVPIGTRVLVVEDDNVLYTTTYSHTEDDPYIVTDTVGGVTVTNSLNNPDMVFGNLKELTKKLDGEDYSGDLFNFNLDGLPKLNSDDSAVDASDVHMQSFSVEAGQFSFDNIPFAQAGTYRYRIYEDMDYLSEFDNDNDTTLSTDFYSDGEQYLVTMEVTQSGLDLIVGDPVFYTYSGDGTNITLADFASSKRINPSAVEFNNHIKTGKVKVEKQGPKNDKLNDVIFEVIKVDDGISDILDSYDNDADRYDAILTYLRTHGDLHVSNAMTGEAGSDGTPAEDGVAIIADLPIYEDGFVTQTGSGVTVTSSGTPVYQNYILIENSGPPNYTINKTINQFSFPINGQYELTFSEDKAYVNGTIKHPDASGPGMMILKIVGLAIILFSIVMLGCYVKRSRRKAFQPSRTGHMRKR